MLAAFTGSWMLAVLAVVRHRARATGRKQSRVSDRSQEILIQENWEKWRSTGIAPVRCDTLHPDLVNLIDYHKDTSLTLNQPPMCHSALTPIARQVCSGITPTVSTIPGALLPSRDRLLASFNEVRSHSLLTEGGRALTKHCHRDSSIGWWGTVKGSAVQVNAIAVRKMEEILEHATWRNVFYLPGDRPVCEFRVQLGYGARWTWSEDSEITFRGFLEPPQENGHQVGWRH